MNRFAAALRHPEFRRGAKDMVGISLGIGAWGLVTGVAMVKGLGVAQAVAMSLLVFAGTAQLAATPLIAADAPIWVVWATALCLNLRFVVFSAQWRPYLTVLPRRQRAAMAFFCADLNYVHFMRRFPEAQPEPALQVPYFWGGVLVNAGAWHVMSLLGIALGHRVPAEWGLGFAGTLALLGMTYSMLADRATWLPALVAGAAAVAAYALPLKLNLLVAIAAAVAIGAVIDHLPRAQAQVDR